jgi:hypothetical protein
VGAKCASRKRARRGRGPVLAAILVLASVAVVGLFAAGCRETAPDFAGTTLDGRAVTLGDYRGRPLILAFIADW